MALITSIDKLIKQQEKLVALATTKKPNNPQKGLGNKRFKDKIQAITEWRMTKTSDMVEKDGKTWYCCPKHVVAGKYNGLYVTRKQEDHDDWMKRREAWRSRKSENSKEAENQKDELEPKRLVLSNNLKAALLTRCDLTGAQADDLIQEAQDDSDF